MQAAKDAGYDVTLRYVALNDPEMNVRRVEGRAAQGGHWIEPETVRRRAANSLENLPAAAAIADRSVLLDNGGATHREVLKLERGRIIYQAQDPPAWLTGQVSRIVSELERVAREGRINPSLSPDGRLFQAAFNEKAEREMTHLDAIARGNVKADFERALVEKEKREGPVVLSAELRRLATAPEPPPDKPRLPDVPQVPTIKPTKPRR